MNNALIVILSIIGLAVIYWVIWGQRSYQRMLGGAQIQKIEGEINRIETAKAKPRKKKKR